MKVNVLKGIMAEKGFTQTAIAKRIGMNKNTLSSRMRGRSSFRVDEIDRICSVLDIIDPELKSDIFLS